MNNYYKQTYLNTQLHNMCTKMSTISEDSKLHIMVVISSLIIYTVQDYCNELHNVLITSSNDITTNAITVIASLLLSQRR